MANLYSGKINTNGTFKTVESLSGLTFSSGTTYTMQVIDDAFIREGTTGNGFHVSSRPFQYTAGNDALYIKGNCYINIAS